MVTGGGGRRRSGSTLVNQVTRPTQETQSTQTTQSTGADDVGDDPRGAAVDELASYVTAEFLGSGAYGRPLPVGMWIEGTEVDGGLTHQLMLPVHPEDAALQGQLSSRELGVGAHRCGAACLEFSQYGPLSHGTGM